MLRTVTFRMFPAAGVSNTHRSSSDACVLSTCAPASRHLAHKTTLLVSHEGEFKTAHRFRASIAFPNVAEDPCAQKSFCLRGHGWTRSSDWTGDARNARLHAHSEHARSASKRAAWERPSPSV